MKVTKTAEQVKQEERRFQSRLYYFTNKLGMSQADAENRADASPKSTNPTPPGELSPWKQRQLAKRKGQPQPLKLKECPRCETKFMAVMRNEDQPQPIGLDTCPCCFVRFYICE